MLAVLVIGVGCAPAAPAAEVTRVTPQEVYERLPELGDDLILLDVRTPEEWSEDGHIEGATLIPLSELETRAAAELPKDAEIIVYCRSGNRSAQAAEYLVSAGYTRVSDMGGIRDWIAAGYPVVKGP
ncbi:MAG TPA: rhodanese-like domain-containing protein [Chloroflexi bacterium]|nr:rhodanese-like domain-containing protein [Chloroflexota bacterium]